MGLRSLAMISQHALAHKSSSREVGASKYILSVTVVNNVIQSLEGLNVVDKA